MTQADKTGQLWMQPERLPESLRTAEFITEPLQPDHAKPDYEALMSCRTRLREELQWGVWPPREFTLQQNEADLRKHYSEFERGEAFAYTVLSPGREQCLGCIYVEPCEAISGAQLAFWVIDSFLDYEQRLVTSTLSWLHAAWSLKRVLVPFREKNVRGIALAQTLKLVRHESATNTSLSEHVCFLSTVN